MKKIQFCFSGTLDINSYIINDLVALTICLIRLV